MGKEIASGGPSRFNRLKSCCGARPKYYGVLNAIRYGYKPDLTKLDLTVISYPIIFFN